MGKITVRELEHALFGAFFQADAERWDQPGLAVGDPDAIVGRVAVNVDMTTEAVIAAAKAGCNVLVTHHPPFIKSGPVRFAPQSDALSSGPGRLIYEAASRGVACIAMHTNADRCMAVRERYVSMLGWDCIGNFEHLMDSSRAPQGSGFGALFAMPAGTVLEDVARHAAAVFGRVPRIWGDADRAITKVALLNGSWGEQEVYDICVANGIECAVVGEARYHFCLDAQPHLSIIDLGHDVSELPIVDVLMQALADAGVTDIRNLGCSLGNWWTLK